MLSEGPVNHNMLDGHWGGWTKSKNEYVYSTTILRVCVEVHAVLHPTAHVT